MLLLPNEDRVATLLATLGLQLGKAVTRYSGGTIDGSGGYFHRSFDVRNKKLRRSAGTAKNGKRKCTTTVKF
jgi:hypothetical protein